MMKLSSLIRTSIFFTFCFFLIACNPQQNEAPVFSQTYVEPTNGYAQMVVTRSVGQKTLHISGQVGEGDSLEAQMRDALAKIKRLLNKEGADYKDLVKINTYIVDYQPEDLDVFRGVRKEIFSDKITPASTLVGVQALALPEWKIEIDAVAVVN